MKLKSLPKELVVEILDYLADYEPLAGLGHVLEGPYSLLDVRGALRELSLALRQELETEASGGLPQSERSRLLSPQAREILSVLSPGDEKRLLARFGLLEE